jgi:hypothetical protein
MVNISVVRVMNQLMTRGLPVGIEETHVSCFFSIIFVWLVVFDMLMA